MRKSYENRRRKKLRKKERKKIRLKTGKIQISNSEELVLRVMGLIG
jgi:hypothetical protein